MEPDVPPAENDTRFTVGALLQDVDVNDGPTPSIQRKILEISRDPGGDLAWLAAHGRDEATRSAAVLILFQIAKERARKPAVYRRVGEGAISVLKEALRSKSVSDQVKVLLGALLSQFDVEFDPEEFRSNIKNLDATIEDVESHLKTPAPTPAGVTPLLNGFGPVSDVNASVPAVSQAWMHLAMTAERFMNERPATAGVLLSAACAAAIFHDVRETELLARAIRKLALNNSPEAMWQLGILMFWPFGGTLGKAAERGYNEMLARGVTPRPAFAPAFNHGYVSSIDGTGERHTGLFFKTDAGMESSLLTSKDTWGLKDTTVVFENTPGIESLFRDSPPEIICVPCSLPLARELFADAVALNVEACRRVPPQAFLCRQYLGEDPLDFSRRTPDLSAYEPMARATRAPLVAASAKLMDVPIYAGLWFASEEAYQFIQTYRRGMALNKDKFEIFLRELCIPDMMDLADRLAVNLEVEALAGRAGRRANRMAECVLSALMSGDVPFWDIPYVRELTKHSVAAIADDLENGVLTLAKTCGHNRPSLFGNCGDDF